MTEIDIDQPALRTVTISVAGASADFDGVGHGAPGTVDAGLASDLVTGILATFSGCGARLVTATGSLGATGDGCNDAYGTADAAAAERFLLAGGLTHAP